MTIQDGRMDMGNSMNFLKQAQQLQEKIKKMQEDLVNKHASGSSGGDMVKATVNGKHEVIDITISKEVVNFLTAAASGLTNI